MQYLFLTWCICKPFYFVNFQGYSQHSIINKHYNSSTMSLYSFIWVFVVVEVGFFVFCWVFFVRKRLGNNDKYCTLLTILMICCIFNRFMKRSIDIFYNLVIPCDAYQYMGSYIALEGLKLNTIHKCFLYPYKRQISMLCLIALWGDRAHRTWHIYNAEKTLYIRIEAL